MTKAKKPLKKKAKAQPKAPKYTPYVILLLIISLALIVGGSLVIKIILGKYFQTQYVQTKIYQFSPKPVLPNTGGNESSNSATISASVKPQPIAGQSGNEKVLPVSTGPTLRVPILYYHYIGNNPNPADTLRDNLSVTPDRFQDEMQYLSQNGYNTISLDTLFNSLGTNTPLPAKPIILTFDDGYNDFFFNAFPILERFNLHATSFIPTGLIGKPAYMSWDQIKQIQTSGLVSFEAHSITHPDLTHLSLDQMKNEIDQSKKILEAEIGVPVNFFAYPYGASNQTVWGLVKQAGFIGAVGTWAGIEENIGLAYDLPRIKIAGGVSLTDFANKL